MASQNLISIANLSNCYDNTLKQKGIPCIKLLFKVTYLTFISEYNNSKRSISFLPQITVEWIDHFVKVVSIDAKCQMHIYGNQLIHHHPVTREI